MSNENLHRLFNLLDPPPMFDALFLVLENLAKIYDTIPDRIENPLWQMAGKQILSSKSVGQYFSEQKIVFLKHLPNLGVNLKSKAKDIRRASLLRITNEAPFWATLGLQPVQAKAFSAYWVLLTQIWLCRTALLEHPNQEILDSSLLPALKSIQALTADPDSAELQRLPTQFIPPDEYLHQIRETPEDLEIYHIANFIDDTIDLLTHNCGDQQELPDKDDPQPHVSETLTNGGIPPYSPEDEDGIDPILPVLPINRATSEIVKNREGHQIRKKLAKENQLFPFSIDILSDEALHAIINYLNQPNDPSLIAELESKALLALSFWSGLDENRISKLTIANTEGRNETAIDFFDYGAGILRLESKYPDIKYTPTPGAWEQLHSRQTHIDLPLPKQAIETLQAHIANEGTPPSERVFRRSPTEIEFRLKQLTKEIREKSGRYMTPGQIRNYISNRLSRTGTGDSAATILTFGNESFLGRTKVHYAAFDQHDLATSYRQLCHQILIEAGQTSSFQLEYPAENTFHIGTPKRPILLAVQQTFEKLSLLIHHGAPAKDTEAFIRQHNYYVAYTAMLIAYSIGFRAVRHPYIESQSYDPESGFCGLGDKDSSAGNRARPIWLPEVCRRHLTLFRQYLNTLVTDNHFNENISHTIENSGLASLFFLQKTSRLTARIVRPKTIEEFTQEVGHFIPLNSQRHFLKSELQENGCPPDAIELFLGHWEIGEEGYSPSSALHPWDYKSSIETHLTPLLRKIGLRPLSGPPLPKSGFAVPINILPKDSSGRNKRKSGRKRKITEANRIHLQNLLGDAVDREKIEDLTTEQFDVLAKAAKILPNLFQPGMQDGVTAESIHKFYLSLGAQRIDTKVIYKQQMFFRQFLNNHLAEPVEGCQLPPPRIIPPEKNLVRTQIGSHLIEFRKLEKKFVQDLELPIPKTDVLRLGQILLSGILFGGLLSRKWIRAVPAGLQHGLHQIGDVLWTDLWHTTGPPTNVHERFLAQMEPARYRRWLPDPTTQLLLYRWLEHFPDEIKTCGTLNAEPTLAAYLRHLGLHYGSGKSALNKLLRIASSFATISLPPFLVAYAKGLLPSASLPDERWIKIFTGRTIPTPKPIQKVSLRAFSKKDYLLSAQLKLRKQLCHAVNPNDNKKKHLPPSTAIKNIEAFVEENQGKMCPVLHFLAQWAIFLLQRRDYEIHPHKKTVPLRNTTVSSYIGNVGESLIRAFRWQNPTYMDVKEMQATYENLSKRVKSSHVEDRQDVKYTQKALKTILTLNMFHWYLEVCHEVPNEAIADLLKSANIKLRQRVSAHIILPDDFRATLQSFDFGSKQRSRLDTISCCFLILAYRAGLRLSEILGLRIMDVSNHDPLDILVWPHSARKVKSESSKRHIPPYLPIPEDECELLLSWFSSRANEHKAKDSSYLFTASEFDTDMLADSELMPQILDHIKQATGDSGSVFHHCRHSFYSMLVFKLLVRKDISLPTTFALTGQLMDLPAELEQAIMGNTATGRTKLHAVAMLAGHADVGIGILSYFHLSDWLLSYHTRHSFAAPQLSAKAIASLLDLSVPQAYYIQRQQGFPFSRSLSRCANKNQLNLTHPSFNIQKKPQAKTNTTLKYISDLPTFTAALENVKQTHFAKQFTWRRPKNSKDLKELECWYNAIRSRHKSTQKKLSRIAKRLNPQIARGYIECLTYQDARDLIWLLNEIGIDTQETNLTFVKSRWRDTKDSRKAFARWQEKLSGLSISISPRPTRRGKEVLRIDIDDLITNLIFMLGQ